MPASFAAALKDLNSLSAIPNSASDVSRNAMLSPSLAVKISAVADEITACPLVYSGKGGV